TEKSVGDARAATNESVSPSNFARWSGVIGAPPFSPWRQYPGRSSRPCCEHTTPVHRLGIDHPCRTRRAACPASRKRGYRADDKGSQYRHECLRCCGWERSCCTSHFKFRTGFLLSGGRHSSEVREAIS